MLAGSPQDMIQLHRAKNEIAQSKPNKLSRTLVVLGAVALYAAAVKPVGHVVAMVLGSLPFFAAGVRSTMLRDEAHSAGKEARAAYKQHAEDARWGKTAVTIYLASASTCLLLVGAHYAVVAKEAQRQAMQDVFVRVESGERTGIEVSRDVMTWGANDFLPHKQTIRVRPEVECATPNMCTIRPEGENLSKALRNSTYQIINGRVSTTGAFSIQREP